MNKEHAYHGSSFIRLYCLSIASLCLITITTMAIVASATNDDDDDGNNEFHSIPKKSFAKNKKRFLYVGNLPGTDETVRNALRTAVVERTGLSKESIQVQGVEENDDSGYGELCSSDAARAMMLRITITGMGHEQALQRLRGLQLQGNKVLVQRERRSGKSHFLITKPTTTTVPGKPSLTGGWSKPKKKKEITYLTMPVACAPFPVNHLVEKAVCMTSSVNDQDPSNGDVDFSTSTLASKVMAEAAAAAAAAAVGRDEEDNDESILDFHTLCQKSPLSTLLDDYGAHDPEWAKVQPSECTDATTLHECDRTLVVCAPEAGVVVDKEEVVAVDETECRLERQGKAPIHVEFVSFGYRHGVPAELRCHPTGNGHRQPLPAYDCRCLPPVPHYLAWMNGLSGAVKNSMLRQTNNSNNHDRRKKADTDENMRIRSDVVAAEDVPTTMHVRDFAKTVAAIPVADAVQAAMEEGGYGYAAPLRMTIHLGSEQGRHRSVVTAELAATALRRLLRQNAGHRFPCSVSVGCRHRDIDQQQPQPSRQQQQQKSNNSSSHVKLFKKQKDLEDD